jgi:hypothetical protein
MGQAGDVYLEFVLIEKSCNLFQIWRSDSFLTRYLHPSFFSLIVLFIYLSFSQMLFPIVYVLPCVHFLMFPGSVPDHAIIRHVLSLQNMCTFCLFVWHALWRDCTFYLTCSPKPFLLILFFLLTFGNLMQKFQVLLRCLKLWARRRGIHCHVSGCFFFVDNCLWFFMIF